MAASRLQMPESPDVRQGLEHVVGDTAAIGKIAAADLGIEQHPDAVGGLVADAGDEVGIHDVMDVGDVLVADALDIVLAEPVVEQGRTFQRLDGNDLGAELLLEIVARGQGAARSGCRNEGGQVGARRLAVQRVERFGQGRAGAQPVDQIVPEFAELIEDHVLRVGFQFGALVVDFLDVALGARRPDDVGEVADPVLEPLETLTAHILGQDGDAAAPHDPRDRHAAAAVVAG